MGTEKKYSVIELAELLGVPRTTINDWLSKYSMYIDFTVQGKRRVYTDSSLAVLKEISGLRNSGMSSVDIEAELAKRHPVRAEPELPEAAPSSSVPQKDGEKVSHSSPPVAQDPAAKKENEFQLIAQRQSEELGKVIGETFQNMALRMEELERLNRAQNSRTKVWMGVTAFVMVLLLTGAYFSYKQVMLFSTTRLSSCQRQRQPKCSRMRTAVSTSERRGQLWSTVWPRHSTEAASRGRMLFLAPCTRISPPSSAGPSMTIIENTSPISAYAIV